MAPFQSEDLLNQFSNDISINSYPIPLGCLGHLMSRAALMKGISFVMVLLQGEITR